MKTTVAVYDYLTQARGAVQELEVGGGLGAAAGGLVSKKTLNKQTVIIPSALYE